MTKSELTSIYRDYIACLNRQDWPSLERFVHEDVKHNGEQLGVSGYRRMLERDSSEIPDLFFHVELLVADPPFIASRLRFHCTPRGNFLGLAVCGRRVSFAENVFYEFRGKKIAEVWSVIDKAAIEAQLQPSVDPSRA
ncbi:ester cyclase [Billgrantia bachuensis]|uniref:SnoaL-like domain-containing protein n=1 Tax=Billgrantia bachuensis TaxID=2717286 RepID=A0ABX0PTS5_9GAMM|nr:ester cyclase [Halomonas bachuensis]NIC06566.1 SnoaL-like domain-containing protein [Halomonas bachuensis]